MFLKIFFFIVLVCFQLTENLTALLELEHCDPVESLTALLKYLDVTNYTISKVQDAIIHYIATKLQCQELLV